MALGRVSPERQRLADLIERDRNKVARNARALRIAALMASRARRSALAAYAAGGNAATAARAAITQPAGIPSILTRLMLTAHLMGRRRTLITAGPEASRPINLSASAFEDALTFLEAKQKVTAAELSHLTQQYGAEAIKATNLAAGLLGQKIGAAIEQATAEGLGVRRGKALIADAFAAAGLAPGNSAQLEQIFRTQTQLAYGAGRWNSQQDAAVQDVLWGYEYVTVGDDRVRPEHAAMEGVRAPKEDPIWQRWTPPNGYNCRCTLLEVWKDDETLAEPTAKPQGVQPDEGWEFNPGKLFADLSGVPASGPAPVRQAAPAPKPSYQRIQPAERPEPPAAAVPPVGTVPPAGPHTKTWQQQAVENYEKAKAFAKAAKASAAATQTTPAPQAPTTPTAPAQPAAAATTPPKPAPRKRARKAEADFAKPGQVLKTDRAMAVGSPERVKQRELYGKEVQSYREYSAKLTGKQRELVGDYIGSGYSGMNAKVRALPPSEPIPDRPGYRELKQLDGTIRNAPPIERDVIVYRFRGKDPGHVVGAEERFGGFVSTGAVPIATFLGDGAYEILIRKGARGVLRGMNASEFEYLFTHGSRFRVLSKRVVRYDRGGEIVEKPTYQLEYLGPD